MKRTKKTNLTIAPRELPIPTAPWLDNWLETPPETEYCLMMDDGFGECLQDVNLTREEFIALKKHLAAMRARRSLKQAA